MTEASGAAAEGEVARASARAAAQGALRSPASGFARAYAALDGARLPLFGRAVDLAALTGSEAAARQYAGGAALVVRVAPPDAPRLSFPAAGVAVRARPLASAPSARTGPAGGGRLLSVALGDVLLVEIDGGLGLAAAPPTYVFAPGPVESGAARARLGEAGGLAIALFEPGRVVFAPALLAETAAGREARVRLGDLVGWRASDSGGAADKTG